MNGSASGSTSLRHYREASEQAAAQIIRSYSTSFSIATRILGERHRTHVRNIYALVRVADELVDGVAAEAQLSPQQQRDSLDALEAETEQAVLSGYSSNPIVQAFASSARLSGIDRSLTAPFFSSMRMDLRTPQDSSPVGAARPDQVIAFDQAAHAAYVFGSAEVVGLMCLRVFMREERRSNAELTALEHGARNLGAAFQNVNFMRDLADDTERLGRSYLSDRRTIDEDLKARWIRTIRTQLVEAEATLPLLPRDARVGVDCAHRLFSELTDKLETTPIEQLLRQRVRVSNFAKARMLAQSLTTTRLGASSTMSASARKTVMK